MWFIFRRILFLLIFTLFFGLIQLWVVSLILFYHPTKSFPGFEILLGDGSLYFFSTSLVFSNLFSLLIGKNFKLNETHWIISIILIGVVLFNSLVAYITIFSTNIGTPSPFKNYLLSQIFTVIFAISYTIYTSTCTGLFKRVS